MWIVRGAESFPPEAAAPVVVALGTFDGVHLGHRAILSTAVERGRHLGRDAVACTFDPHPIEVLQPGRAPLPITPLDERLALIARTGIAGTVVLEFTPTLAALEAETFVKDMLVGRLRSQEIVVGYNHTFGRGARGNAAVLAALGERLGFRVHVVPPYEVDGVPVSSTAIRAALQGGDVERATHLLGRPYALGGRVVPGEGRGRGLGFPTANLEPDRPVLVRAGVYACTASVQGGRYPAVVNVGVRPTFGGGALAVEAHLLDFTRDLYGDTLRLEFVRRLRDEARFPSVEALREQIARDIASARTG